MGADAIVRAEGLCKYFPTSTEHVSVFPGAQQYVYAVDDISFEIGKGEIFGLAGESGCGKTTTGRLLVRLVEPTAGKVYFEGVDIFSLQKEQMRELRQRMQMIFQNPFEALNPRMRVLEAVSEPLINYDICASRSDLVDRVANALREVDLAPVEDFFFRFPHELSGGQRQRTALARALVLNPEFIVADEPVSMLDVSIRAEVLNVMVDLRDKFHLSILFVTHDLALARHICDRLAIMYLGKIVEIGETEKIIRRPLHPYTAALISAVPRPDPKHRVRVEISGEVPKATNPPPGCRFHPRCPSRIPKCSHEIPLLSEEEKGHYVACHLI